MAESQYHRAPQTMFDGCPRRQRFAGRAFVSQVYSKRISELMRSLRKKHGISRPFSSRTEIAYPPVEEQMQLFR